MTNEDVTAFEPLMQGSNHSEDDHNEQKLSTRTLKVKAGAFIYALTFAAGVSGLLFGYE